MEGSAKISVTAGDIEFELEGTPTEIEEMLTHLRQDDTWEIMMTRLNAAKKKEAVKANAAEHYEEQVDQLESSVADYKAQVESLTSECDQLQEELGEWKEYAEKRTKQLETSLNDEKKLNDERKRHAM